MDYESLVQFNNWANARLLETAAQLTPKQLHSGKLSKGTGFETLRHVLDVEWSWRMACEEKPASEELWKIEPLEDFAAVRARWEAEGASLLAFVQSLRADDFERVVTPSWEKASYKIDDIIMHIIIHATDHRSELGWFFTGLGHSPGDIEWLGYVDAAS